MQVILSHKKGRNRGTIALWVNDPDLDSQELIKMARKKMESYSEQPVLTGEEKWSIKRDLF